VHSASSAFQLPSFGAANAHVRYAYCCAGVAPAVGVAHLYQNPEEPRSLNKIFDRAYAISRQAVTFPAPSARFLVPSVVRILSLWLRRKPR
jgi:hypothetical protein